MMTIMFWAIMGMVLLWGAALTWQVIWSRRDTWHRSVALLAYAIMIPVVAAASVELLGHARPVTWEAIKALGEGNLRARILGHKVLYGKAIYLYLDRAGEPLSLVLPWDDETAEELQGAMRRDGTPMLMLPYEWSWDKRRKPKFDVVPPPKMPDKPLEERRVKPYERGAEWRNTCGGAGDMIT